VWVDLSEGVGFMGNGWSDLWGRGIEVVGGWWEGSSNQSLGELMSEEAWKAAIRNSSVKYDTLQEAWKTKDSAQILTALAEYREAENEREIAEVNAGYCPAWPPKTEEGRRKYGLTVEEVENLISKMK